MHDLRDSDRGSAGTCPPPRRRLPGVWAEDLAAIIERTAAADNDLIFFGADTAKVVNDALGALRLRVGHDQQLTATGWRPLWVVDFPMFEWDPDERRWVAMHHPFTAPAPGDWDLIDRNPSAMRAQHYDMVLNGYELGSGSIRIHKADEQRKIFEQLKTTLPVDNAPHEKGLFDKVKDYFM